MPADDRDTKFERALEQHWRAGSAQAGCPDAETLAAYHERSLSLEEMAHWKLHIAGCALCQEALSLVEVTGKQLAEEWAEQPIPLLGAAGKQSTAPPRAAKAARTEMAAAAVKAGQRPALMRWAVPIGAVAAGVLVWIGMHQMHMPDRAKSPSVQVAEKGREAAPAPSLNAEVATKAEPPISEDLEQHVPAVRGTRPPPASRDKESMQERLAPGVAADSFENDEGAAKKQAAPEAPPPVGEIVQNTAPPQPPPPKAQAPSVRTEAVEVSPAVPLVQAEGKPVDLPVTASAGNAVEDQKHIAAMNRAKSAPPPQAESQLPSPDANNAMMYSQGVNRAMIQASKLDSGVIVTPDHKVWWKIGVNGAVELTTDAGKNWKTLATGVAAQLTSGAAPSSKVCWIAGQSGTLLLTTDRGGHWKSLTTPISGDLGGVHAADAKRATIWDTANRLSYETSDGGATWKQVANE